MLYWNNPAGIEVIFVFLKVEETEVKAVLYLKRSAGIDVRAVKLNARPGETTQEAKNSGAKNFNKVIFPLSIYIDKQDL